MATMTKAPLMTTEELLALPENGFERWLIRGQLREKPATLRDRWHSAIMARLATVLESWRELQSESRAWVLCGNAGCRIQRSPDKTVGIDVAYISAEVARQNANGNKIIDGVPVLAVEILSPNDTQEEIDEKVDKYLRAGVALVWVIDPHDETVRIYRKNRAPELVNVAQHLTGDPELPGFHVAVSEIFA